MGYLTLCHQYLHSCPTLLCLITLTPSCGLSVGKGMKDTEPEDKEHRAWARQGGPEQEPATCSRLCSKNKTTC